MPLRHNPLICPNGRNFRPTDEEIWDQTLTPKRSLISHLHSVCPFRQASFLKGASRIFSKLLALAYDLATENECFQRVFD